MGFGAKNNFLIVLLFLNFISSPAFAQDTIFRSMRLAHGITLDVPFHWVELSIEDRKNIRAAGRSMTDNAGIEGASGRKEPLLAIVAMPNPSGATIRVSITTPPDYTQTDLTLATPADLKEVGAEMLKNFRQLESSGVPKIIDMQPIRIERFNNYQSLVMPYVRAGLNGSSPWQVTQYKIPVSNHLIEITFSYRQSDGVVWRPILERVKRSVKF